MVEEKLRWENEDEERGNRGRVESKLGKSTGMEVKEGKKKSKRKKERRAGKKKGEKIERNCKGERKDEQKGTEMEEKK